VAVAAFEGFLPVITHGVDVVVGEFLTRDVLDPQPGLKFLGVIAHRVQQVGLTQAGTTGDEQRVEGLRGTLRHGNRGGVGEPVERPDHKVMKRVLRVQRHFPVGVVSWGFTRDAQGVGRLWRWFHRSRTGVKTLVEGRHAVGLFPGACALRRLAPLTTNDILPRRLIPWGLLVLGRSMGPGGGVGAPGAGVAGGRWGAGGGGGSPHCRRGWRRWPGGWAGRAASRWVGPPPATARTPTPHPRPGSRN